MGRRLFLIVGGAGVLGVLLAARHAFPDAAEAKADDKLLKPIVAYEWALPNDSWKAPFKDEQPVYFVNRSQATAEWDKLPAYWNPATEKAVDPGTGKEVERQAVKIKVPLGLTSNPPVPADNPVTVAKWALGKRLYYDNILSSDASVSCASCHDPQKGFTDVSPVSTGIRGKRGGMSSPTVLNSAYNLFQFWDGRASSLEDQSQGPIMNPVEMFGGDGHAWNQLIKRVRAKPDYVKQFKLVFGTEPTRDAVAKAISTYERTVLSGNSVHDRAELAMRQRVDEEGSGKYVLKAADYAKALQAAFAAKDAYALKALKLDPAKDAGEAPAVAKRLLSGRNLFFDKARCNLCHVGDNFTDNGFHNLGVGFKDGKLAADQMGRFGAQPTGAKDPAMVGAFKTPTLRHLGGTAPYMHDGSEKTLEDVVNFYDKGGNPNEFLDPKMRDEDAERAYNLSAAEKKPYKGPEVKRFGPAKKPVAPRKLGLTDQEKKDLVLFLRALQGDAPDPIVGDKDKYPK